MFKLLGCCMSKEDIFENLVYNPFGKNNHAVLSEVMKTYPISSLFVSNKQLSFIHSYVYHVKEQTLSNDILDYAVVGMNQYSNPIAWEIVMLLITRIKYTIISELVEVVSQFPQSVYISNQTEILEFFANPIFMQNISEVQAIRIFDKLSDDLDTYHWGSIFGILHNVCDTDSSIIEFIPIWNQMDVNDFLTLLWERIVTENSPLIVWRIFNLDFHVRIESSIKNKNYGLIAIDRKIRHQQMVESITELMDSVFPTRYKVHDREVVTGCILSFFVIRFHHKQNIKLKVDPTELRDFISLQSYKYYCLGLY